MKKVILTKLNEILEDNPFVFDSSVDIKDLKIKTKQIKTPHGVIEVIEHHEFNGDGMLVLSEIFLNDCLIYKHIK